MALRNIGKHPFPLREKHPSGIENRQMLGSALLHLTQIKGVIHAVETESSHYRFQSGHVQFALTKFRKLPKNFQHRHVADILVHSGGHWYTVGRFFFSHNGKAFTNFMLSHRNHEIAEEPE